jgi:integrase
VDAGAVLGFLEGNWSDKLPTQRAMKGWLSKFFGWAVLRRHVAMNPCRKVTTKMPKARTVYIPHAHFLTIRAALATYKRMKDGEVVELEAKVPTGPEMQVFVDLWYLTCQRSTDIWELRWSQVDRLAGLIHFVPSKTADSSGESVDWPIRPEIEDVLRCTKELPSAASVDSKSRSWTAHASKPHAIRDGHTMSKSRQNCFTEPSLLLEVF